MASKFVPIKYRSANGYDPKEASDAAGYVETMPSLTVQSQKNDADINVLMDRFGITGTVPVNHRLPEFGDYSEVTDFRSALGAIEAASDNFMQLPAAVRARFENDPQLFLEFVSNPSNLDEMRTMGLANPKKVEDTIVAPKVEPTTK